MKIIVCVDGSLTSEEAFKWYCNDLHQSSNNVFVVHVSDEPKVPSFVCYEKAVFPQEEFDLCIEKCKAKVDEVKNKFLALADSFQVSCQFIMLREDGGTAGEALIKYVKSNPADVAIVGTRGLGKLRRTIMGSVSNYVVHHAPMPVIVYRK